MTRIVRLVQTCVACPSQWDGWTDDGRRIYIRYRWGYGSVSIAAPGDGDEYAAVNGECIAEWEGAESLDGYISEAEMMAAVADKIEWAIEQRPATPEDSRDATT